MRVARGGVGGAERVSLIRCLWYFIWTNFKPNKLHSTKLAIRTWAFKQATVEQKCFRKKIHEAEQLVCRERKSRIRKRVTCGSVLRQLVCLRNSYLAPVSVNSTSIFFRSLRLFCKPLTCLQASIFSNLLTHQCGRRIDRECQQWAAKVGTRRVRERRAQRAPSEGHAFADLQLGARRLTCRHSAIGACCATSQPLSPAALERVERAKQICVERTPPNRSDLRPSARVGRVRRSLELVTSAYFAACGLHLSVITKATTNS